MTSMPHAMWKDISMSKFKPYLLEQDDFDWDVTTANTTESIVAYRAEAELRLKKYQKCGCFPKAPGSITLHEDGTVSVRGTVDIAGMDLAAIPFKFRKITGSFFCNANKLKSLDGCPEFIGDDFNCSYNDLTSLLGGPKVVKGSYLAINNKLNTIEGFPLQVGDADDHGAELHYTGRMSVKALGFIRVFGNIYRHRYN